MLKAKAFNFSAKIKKKMLYSSSFDALKKCLVGVQKYIQVDMKLYTKSNTNTNLYPKQATDESEASEEEIEQQLRKTDRI